MNILITGVTGFLGKVVLLDILNHYYCKVDKIYILIRRKRKKSSEERFKNIYNNKFINKYLTPFLNKIYLLEGDLEEKNFGIDTEILDKINIDIIINNAASIKFNDKMSVAYKNNCETVINILECCEKFFKNLKKFIHVSTFYVNFPKDKNSNTEFNYNDVINDIKNGQELEEINQKYKCSFANSYVFTKFLAEEIIKNDKNIFVKNIIRPSIIANSYNFPYSGWNDSYAAYTGFNLSFGTGIINYILTDKESGFSLDKKLNTVPVDYVSKIISETTFNNNKELYINAIIENKECCNFNDIKKSLKYYNVINHNGKYVFVDVKYFWFLNMLYDYLPYKFLHSLFYFFDKKKSNKMQYICTNLSNINKTFFYYIHNEWETNSKSSSYDMKYYHNIIVPRGNNKFLLNKNLNKYSVIKDENQWYFDSHWLMNKLSSNSITNMTAYLLRKTFRKIFSDILVDVDKLIEIIYNYEDKESLVICPNHRSYCDFLLISYVLFELKSLGVKLPRIAATSDFQKIPIIGSLFEQLGCFYVERGKGRVTELNNKISRMIDNKENIEFFIEGTRSRTRQTLPFKTGLIKALQETGKKFTLIPVTISYEKIPEQNVFMEEIMTGQKFPMNIKGLFRWAGKKFFDKDKYGNVYISFSDVIELKPKDNSKDIGNKICRQFQLNSIFTEYHFKFPINSNVQIEKSGLNSKNHSSQLEEWICMNQWIFKYILKENANNFWENEYIQLYDYLENKDKIIDENNIQYHKKYFKYLNNDIQIILNQKNKFFSEINTDNLVLGNISIIFVKKILEKYNLFDDLGKIKFNNLLPFIEENKIENIIFNSSKDEKINNSSFYKI